MKSQIVILCKSKQYKKAFQWARLNAKLRSDERKKLFEYINLCKDLELDHLFSVYYQNTENIKGHLCKVNLTNYESFEDFKNEYESYEELGKLTITENDFNSVKNIQCKKLKLFQQYESE